MTFPVMPLRHVFCIMALMLSCSSVAVFADEGTRDPQPAITPPTAAAFSGLGGLPDVNPVSHSSSGSLPSGAAGAIPFPGVPGIPPYGAVPDVPGAGVPGPVPAPGRQPVPGSNPGVLHHLDGTLGSYPDGADSVVGVPGAGARPPAGVLFSPQSSTVHPGPGEMYRTCDSVLLKDGKRIDSNCVPKLSDPASSVGNPGKFHASGGAALNPGVPGIPDSQSGTLLSTLTDGQGGRPRVGDLTLDGDKAGKQVLNTPVPPVPAPVDQDTPAAIPGFPGGYPGAGVGVTVPVHPTTPLGSHPGAGPIVSQHNDQVPGAASGPSGGKGNQAGSTVAASPPEVSTPANNQSGGKKDADAVSVVQPSSQPPTAPAQSESTTHTPNSSNTKGSQSTTTGTTTVPPVTANSKKPKGKGDANSSRISSVWVRVPLLIVVALATVLVC